MQYVMIVGAIFIPTNLAELLALIRNQSQYEKPYKMLPDHSHVVCIGNFEVTSLRDFLREFFCEVGRMLNKRQVMRTISVIFNSRTTYRITAHQQ